MKMNTYMKKSLAAAAFSSCLVGNVFASCDNTPFVGPSEMRPACEDQTSRVKEAAVPTANQINVSEAIDSKGQHNAHKSEKLGIKQSSQNNVK